MVRRSEKVRMYLFERFEKQLFGSFLEVFKDKFFFLGNREYRLVVEKGGSGIFEKVGYGYYLQVRMVEEVVMRLDFII